MENLTIYPNRLEKFMLPVFLLPIPFGMFFLFHSADWMTLVMIWLILVIMPGAIGIMIGVHVGDRVSFLEEGGLVKTFGKPEKRIPWEKLACGYYVHDGRNRPYVILAYRPLQDWERKKLICRRGQMYDLILKHGVVIPISCCVSREEEDRRLTLLEGRVSFQNERSELRMF